MVHLDREDFALERALIVDITLLKFMQKFLGR